MSAAGGGIRFTISANASQVVEAANEGRQALADLAASYKIAAEQMNLVAEATRLMGAEQGQAYAAMIRAADGTEMYDGTLSALRAQLQLYSAQQAQANAAASEFHGAVSALQGVGGPVGSIGSLVGTIGALANGTSTFGAVAQDVALGGLGLLTDGFGAVIGMGAQFMSQMWAMTGGMIQFQIFGWAAQQVQSLSQEMMQLNETMQNQYVGWAYLFGGPGANGGKGGPDFGASSQLMQWTATQSYNAPFTRQDINQAISTLQTVGLDKAGIEKYIPVMEDLAVRNPGLSLSQIAQSVMGAEFGYTRMLRYDLRIAPQELEKYGLSMADGTRIDPSTLLPALLNYARDQGYYNPTGPGGEDQGASYMLAHNTFQGAMTSWQDRYQNMLLELGGTLWGDQPTGNDKLSAADVDAQYAKLMKQGKTADAQALLDQYGGGITVRNPTYNPNSKKAADQQQYITEALGQAGDIQKGSLLDDMIVGLNKLTSWWDAHQQDLDKMGEIFSQGIGAGLKTAGQALQGFLDGLKQSGVGTDVLNTIKDAVAWLADPKNQQQVKDLATAVGADLGVALKGIGDDLKVVGNYFTQLSGVLGAGDILKDIYVLGEAFVYFNDQLQKGIEVWTLWTRVTIDALKAAWDASHGNFAGAQSDLADMGQAWSDYNKEIQQINKDTADSIKQLTMAFAQLAANQQIAAQKAAASQVASHPTKSGDLHQAQGTAAAGYSSYGVAGGTSGTSYGDTNITNYIYGADSRTVQQIVNNKASAADVNASLAAKRPGAGRLRLVGLVY